jgi:hypothetical protein
MTPTERLIEAMLLTEEGMKHKRLAWHFEHYPFQWSDD